MIQYRDPTRASRGRHGFFQVAAVAEKWSSRIGFTLAAIGSAVGLGSVWRFPTIVGENGGGAYLVPYLVAVFLCATPLMVLEFAAGRHYGTDVVSAFRRIDARFAVIGWIIVSVCFLILSYYLVVSGWTLAFAVFAAAGTATGFEAFTSTLDPVLFFFVTTALAAIIVSSGIRGGIERVSTLMIPFIVVVMLLMAGFVATLPGSAAGIAYYLTPDFSVLLRPALWISAVGQSFYTLSIGMGILVTYGAYLEKDEDILKSSLVVSAGDLAISLLSGLIIFPIVFSFGLLPEMGARLAFSTLPRGFALMPFGNIAALAFFVLLFLTALLSSIALLEVLAAAVTGATGWPRRRACLVLAIALFLAGLPAALSYSGMHLTVAGANVLDAMDDILGTVCVVVTGILTSVVLAWYVDQKTLESGIGSGSRVVRWIVPACRTVIPAALVAVLAMTLLAGGTAG